MEKIAKKEIKEFTSIILEKEFKEYVYEMLETNFNAEIKKYKGGYLLNFGKQKFIVNARLKIKVKRG